jgi:hypothetical protein
VGPWRLNTATNKGILLVKVFTIFLRLVFSVEVVVAVVLGPSSLGLIACPSPGIPLGTDLTPFTTFLKRVAVISLILGSSLLGGIGSILDTM